MKMSIVKNTDDVVVIEVEFEDKLDRLSHPGFMGNEKYIKYTKGKNHTLSTHTEDMQVIFSMIFGDNGMTMVSGDHREMRDRVRRFILSQGIQPINRSSSFENNLKIMPPKRGLGVPGKYCVHLGGQFAAFLDSESQIEKLFGPYTIHTTYQAPTGAIVHECTLDRIGKDPED